MYENLDYKPWMTKLEDFKSLYDHDYTPVFQQQKV